MIAVTPIGVLTEFPGESRRFYRDVMGIEKVQAIREVKSHDVQGTLLRLESPLLEVFSTETRYVDRTARQVIRKDYFLQLRPRNMKTILNNLESEEIEIQADFRGNLRFQDLNGLSWEIKVDFEGIT